MDTQEVNNAGNPTAPKPRANTSSSRTEVSSPSAPKPTGDTVSLSSSGQGLAQSSGASASASSSNERRQFSVTENNDVVLKVIDPQTQKVVKSVPSEEQLQLKDAIREGIDDIS